MNEIFKVFLAGAAGVFAQDVLAPQIAKVFKPDSEFAAKAVRAGTGGVATVTTYVALNFLMSGGKSAT
jgi:hypothetical protein